MKLGLIEFVAMAMTSRASFAAPQALAASILFQDSCSFSEKHDVWGLSPLEYKLEKGAVFDLECMTDGAPSYCGHATMAPTHSTSAR